MKSSSSPGAAVTVGRAAAAIVAALGLRAAYFYVRYNSGDASIAHHHIESAVFVFAACGIALAIGTARAEAPARRPSEPSRLWLVVFAALAFSLYWRALGVGLLSDDFVLASRAATWHIGAVSLGLFRPVPLVLWSLALSVGAGPVVLHAINVALHALAAYLTMRVAHAWTRDARWSVAAGLVFVTSPIATEAVAWCSGIFDVSATVLVLATVLAARRAEREPTRSAAVAVWVLAIAAILSKEVAVVVPGLLLIDAFGRRALSARAFKQAGLLLVVAAAYGAVRLTMAAAVVKPEAGRYVIQRAIFSTFGSLAVPLHERVMANLPVLALLSALLLLTLILTFVFRPAVGSLRAAGAATLWSAAGIVPVLPFVFAAPDLQFSRYFYLPLAGWAGLVATMGASGTEGGRVVTAIRACVVAGIVGIGAVGVVEHVSLWPRAAESRDRFLNAVRLDDRMRACRAVSLEGLPDSVAGAYVFRNGVAEALEREAGLTFDSQAGAGCTFTWDERAGAFVSKSPQG